MSPERRGETFVLKEPAEGIDFVTFVMGLASSALIHLGAKAHPETGRVDPDLTLARQSLDLLAMLQEKTRGNLTDEESQVLGRLLADLRLRFVEAKRSSASG